MARRPSAAARIRPDQLTADARCAIVHGADRFLQQLYIDALRGQLEDSFGEIDVIRTDGKAVEPAEVLDECRSFGLMTTHKLVVVDDADQMLKREGVRPIFERYAQAPSESATLVLRASTWHKGKLDKAGEAGGGILIPCKAMSEPEAVAWIGKRTAKAHGVSIDRNAAARLVERAGTDLAKLDAELAKLASHAGAGGTITPEHVREMIGRSREESAWVVQETLLRGNPAASMHKINELLTVSRVPPILLRRAMLDLAKKLHAVGRAARDGGNPAKPGASVRVWGPVIDAGRSLSPDISAMLLEEAVRADRAAKTGRGDEVRGLEILAARFARALAR